MKAVVHIFVLFLAIGLWSCSEFTRVQKSGTTEEKYAKALEYYEEKDYYRAGVLLEDIRPYIAGTKEAEKALLYSAFCEYYDGSQYIASFGFKKFFETYPRSQHAEEATFMYAEALYDESPSHNLDQTNTYEAIEAYQSFLVRYPDTEYKEQCNNKVDELRTKLEFKAYENAKLQLKIGHYRAAVVAFENFKYDYPISQYNEEIAYLKIKAQYEWAKNSLEQVLKDGKIIKLKKERFDTAVKYYQQFIDKYPDSEFAKEAETLYNTILSKTNS